MSALTQAVPLDAVMDLGSSYVECLRTMNAAALRGVKFKMDVSLQPVVGLPPDSLELLIGMAQDFNRQECVERCIRNRKEGVKYGRPNKALPENFLVEAHKWADGATNLRAAAKNCGMAPATFRLHVERAGIIPDKKARKNGRWPLPEKWEVLVQKLLDEEITFEGAALRAGLSVKSFKQRLGLHREEIRKLAPQTLLDACQAWAEKKCTRKKAAMQAGYKLETFKSLLRVLSYERSKQKFSKSDNAQ